jgi:hypothetical protein
MRRLVALVSTLAQSGGGGPPKYESELYWVKPSHLAEADEEVRRCEQEWRRAGAVRVTEQDVEQALRKAEDLQREFDQARARSRLGLVLGYLYLVRLFVLTGLPRYGKAAVLGISAAVVCGLSLLLSPFLFSSLAAALGGASVMTATGAIVVTAAVFLLWPTESKRQSFQRLQRERKGRKQRADSLQAPVSQAWAEYQDVRLRWRLTARLDEARRRHQELASLLASAKYQLIHSDWRSLRSTEFEQFLSRVFETLGYHVELTKASGDQGADLVVAGKGRRIAVQAKGYADSVGNHSVMEVVAGRAFYGCDSCAVVTNSRFTRTARRLAEANRCTLIDGSGIPDLIEGRIY